MMLWKRTQPTVEEKQLLAATQEKAEQQKEEAHRLLGISSTLADVLRQSQKRNNYAQALDEVFGAKRRKEE